MIKIERLSKSYGDHRIVDDLSLRVARGTIFGFLGPNGAGKTTAMKMIVGLNAPDNGTIEIGGNDPRDIKARQRIGYMPEDPYFYEHLSALEFLIFMGNLFSQKSNKNHTPPNLPFLRGGKKERNSSLNSPPKTELVLDPIGEGVRGGMNNNEAMKQLNNLLEMVGLENVGQKKIKDFSKGMKQRLGLAQALVNDPDYLFLDEPLDGLDPIGRVEFKRIFLDLKRRGKTIFFNSHILSDIEEICDSIGIIDQGGLIYTGPTKKFTGSKTLEQKFIEAVMEK
ncbi:MAG: ABC transporter ATP-binding protein [Patescibacteria group bacterium]